MIYVIGPDNKEIQINESQLKEYESKGYEQSFSLLSPQGEPTIVPMSQLKSAKDSGYQINPEFKPDVSKLESFGKGFIKELSFDLADEGAGVVGALSGKGYEKSKAAYQQKQALADIANPKTFTAGQIGGGVAGLAIPLGGSAKGLSGVMRAGAIEGGLQGFGQGEGAAESLIGAAGGAALGAGIGAGLSKAANALQPVVEAGVTGAKKAVVGTLGKAAELGGQSPEANAAYRKFLANPKLIEQAENSLQKFKDDLPKLAMKAQGFADNIAEATGSFFEKNFKEQLSGVRGEDLVKIKQAVGDALMKAKESPKDFSKSVKDLLSSSTAKAPRAKDGNYAWELRRNIDDILYREGQRNANLNRYDSELLQDLRNSIQETLHTNPAVYEADRLYSEFSDKWGGGLKKEMLDKSGKVTHSKVEQLLSPSRQSEGRRLDIQEKWDDLENFIENNADKLPKELRARFDEFKSEKNPLQLLKEYNKIKAEGGFSTGKSLAGFGGAILGSPLTSAAATAIYNPQGVLSTVKMAGKGVDAAKWTLNVVDKLMQRGFSKQQAEQLAARLGAKIMMDEED